MNEQARISYWLSDRGRRDLRRKGGDGRRQQSVVGLITNPDDLELFDVDEEGDVSFDATTAPTHSVPDDKCRYTLFAPDGGVARIEVAWNVVPSWDDLLQFARWAQQVREKQYEEEYLEYQADEKADRAVADAFLADPNARAEKITERGVVTIAGRNFYSPNEEHEEIVREARARAERDQEELKKANRATLAEWTAQHGTPNQRQRLAAGLLPWKEIYDAAEAQLYAPLAAFPLYKRFNIGEVCECVAAGAEKPCNVKFQSVDATELTAEEWDQYSKIRAAVPHATFQLREHSATCQIAYGPQIRRGVIVKMSLGKLSFKRPFALTEVSHDAL